MTGTFEVPQIKKNIGLIQAMHQVAPITHEILIQQQNHEKEIIEKKNHELLNIDLFPRRNIYLKNFRLICVSQEDICASKHRSVSN